MLTDAIRSMAEWGSDLSNGVGALDLKTLATVAALLMGGTWLVATEFSARDERAAATESDVRLLSQSVNRLSVQIGNLAERQDSMDRRLIQYHNIYMENIEELAAKIDGDVTIPPPPYRGDNG